MSSFTTPLYTRPLTGRSRGRRALYEVMGAFRYALGADGSGVEVIVPVGFVTDFASFPYWLVRAGFKPRSERYHKAALCHDVLVTDAAQVDRLQRAVFTERKAGLIVAGVDLAKVIRKPIPRRLFADLVFWEMMSVSKVNPALKVAMFIGVRIGALGAWGEARLLKGCGHA
ncbi:MAG: DUF1353 domain-containing protein [Alphaproteobacteria bacterium]